MYGEPIPGAWPAPILVATALTSRLGVEVEEVTARFLPAAQAGHRDITLTGLVGRS